MKVMLLLLAAASLHELADATRLTISKIDWTFYVETDPEHFATFGMIKYGQEERKGIISVDEKGQYHLTSKCESGWTDIKKVKQATKDAYKETRKNHLAFQILTWSDTFSSDQKEEKTVRSNLATDSRMYSSKHFPSKLARVVTSGDVAAFVHYDGSVRMKTTKCLGRNEKILIEGLKLIQPDWDKSLFSPSGNKVLEKYLKQHPIDEASFYREQDYSTM